MTPGDCCELCGNANGISHKGNDLTKWFCVDLKMCKVLRQERLLAESEDEDGSIQD